MAAPNYSFEKRKRDNAKKAAKEAKKLRKLEKGATSQGPVIIEHVIVPVEGEGDASTEPPVA